MSNLSKTVKDNGDNILFCSEVFCVGELSACVCVCVCVTYHVL